MVDAREDSDVEVLERGNIYFFYRPRVGEHEPESVQDLQNFYVILSPYGKKTYRLLVVGRERLPDPEHAGRERHWGFVDAIYSDAKKLSEDLREDVYRTKTRGERHRPAARPAGQGVYEVVMHGGHSHLVYALDLPKEPGEVQRQLGIRSEASYVLSVKNPDKPSPPRAGLPQGAAKLPKGLMDRFRDRKFADVDPPEFLDHEAVELLLVAASSEPQEELGSAVPQQVREGSVSPDVFRDLRLHKSKHPTEPLFEGHWE